MPFTIWEWQTKHSRHRHSTSLQPDQRVCPLQEKPVSAVFTGGCACRLASPLESPATASRSLSKRAWSCMNWAEMRMRLGSLMLREMNGKLRMPLGAKGRVMANMGKYMGTGCIRQGVEYRTKKCLALDGFYPIFDQKKNYSTALNIVHMAMEEPKTGPGHEAGQPVKQNHSGFIMFRLICFYHVNVISRDRQTQSRLTISL